MPNPTPEQQVMSQLNKVLRALDNARTALDTTLDSLLDLSAEETDRDDWTCLALELEQEVRIQLEDLYLHTLHLTTEEGQHQARYTPEPDVNWDEVPEPPMRYCTPAQREAWKKEYRREQAERQYRAKHAKERWREWRLACLREQEEQERKKRAVYPLLFPPERT